jgi:hypothetical protein
MPLPISVGRRVGVGRSGSQKTCLFHLLFCRRLRVKVTPGLAFGVSFPEAVMVSIRDACAQFRLERTSLMRRIPVIILLLSLMSLSVVASETAPIFHQLNGFPSSPGGFGFSVTSAALGDGRFILWDGDAVFLETAPGAGTFAPLADGYSGDPAFIAVAPDGHTCLLGAGYSGDLFVLDAAAPVSSGVPVANLSHFSGVFISADKVVVDAAIDLGGSVYEAELGVLDLSVDPPAYQKVVAEKGGASAFLALAPGGAYLVAADGLTGETRRFAVADLLQAEATATPLDWAAGDPLGTYTAGGPAACTDDYALFFASYSGEIVLGSPASIDPASLGSFSRTVSMDPEGSGTLSYTLSYSAATDTILAVGTDYGAWPPTITGWVTDDVAEVPVAGPIGLAALALALSAMLARGSRR